mmetsp:Transcript_7073/g.14348  ORF Transcript_7073/g.14348 Transcript_7073/m.14348 type:complete len:122 (+) Transcript_7073:584-949(+)
MIGFLVFTTFYFTMTVFTISLAYLRFGGLTNLYGMLTEFSLVMLYKHFVGGELFAFSLHATPSNLDSILGPLMLVRQLALKNLPKFVPPKEREMSPKSPIIDKRKSRKAVKTVKVAPQGKE